MGSSTRDQNEKRPTPIFRQRLEFLLLTQRDDVLSRAKAVISEYYLTFKQFPNLESAGSGRELNNAQIVLIAQEEKESLKDFSSRVEVLLQRFSRSWILTVLHESSLRENLAGTQNDRVIPLSPSEFFSTLKFEYICLQKARSQFFEMAPSDLFPMTELPFTVSVRLPLNQKFLGVAYKGLVLSENKYQRLRAVDSIYFPIQDGPLYYRYINTYFDASGAALKKKARALFLSVCSLWLEMNEYLLFDFKSNSEVKVRECYTALLEQATALIDLMGTEESLWDVFRESVQNDLFVQFRSPWIATYAALMCKKSGQGDPLVAFISGLFADVGLFDISDGTAAKYLQHGDKDLNENESKELAKHPVLSLNRCLIKKLPLNEAVKSVLVTVHERHDEKGYPNQVPADKLPLEAQAIRFAGLIDLGVRTTMAETGVGFRFMKEKLWEREQSSPGSFSLEFLNSIAESLI